MKFSPKYTITNKLLNNIRDINKQISYLNNKRFPQPILYKLNTDAKYQSTHSSTSIEGNPYNLTKVKEILKQKKENYKDTEQEIINYNNALIYLNRKIKDKDIEINNRLILKTHRLVTDKLLNKANTGKYRFNTVVVNNPLLNKIIYIPPDYRDVKPLTNSLIKYINTNIDKIDPLILAGIFHKQFVLIHPFMDGNGRTTRLLTKVILAHLGIDTFELFSFENFYNRNVTKYFEKVGEIGEYYDLNTDFTYWLEYFTDGILDEINRVIEILEDSELTPEHIILKDQAKILEYIKINGYITTDRYSQLTDRAKATRATDFNKLINLGLIERKGKGKNTYYINKE